MKPVYPIWHPFTQMKTADSPIAIERARGTLLYGADGKTYIDAISSWWVNLHGHAHPLIAERIAEQARTLEQVIFAGFTHPPALALAQGLLRLLPGCFSRVFFSDNGSTAVEVALKMAIQYWRNRGAQGCARVIALEHAYHGDTFGAMAVGARGPFSAPFDPYLFEVERLPPPDEAGESLRRFSALLDRGDVAAFIFEPLVQGAAGMRMHSAAALDGLLAEARQRGVLCIADEVMTGFGRTGRTFATEYLTQEPDIICLSKGLTGGFLPMGVTACAEPIYQAFYADQPEKTFFHGHSYTANPLACAAAIASLELLESPDCQARIASIAHRHAAYAQTLEGHKQTRGAQSLGSILAIEIEAGPSSYFNAVRDRLYRFYIDRGVLLRPLGNVVYVMPPYCVLDEELDRIYTVITQSLSYLQSS